MSDRQARFDPEADAAYLRLADGRIENSSEIADGIIVDWGAGDEPLGLEVLHVKRRLKGGDLDSFMAGLAEGLFAKRIAAE